MLVFCAIRPALPGQLLCSPRMVREFIPAFIHLGYVPAFIHLGWLGLGLGSGSRSRTGLFTPLIFTTTGGMADAATQVFKRLPNILSIKHGLSYGMVMGWVQCKLNFSLLRSAFMCIHGAQSSLRCPVTQASIAVQVAEAQI